MSYPKARIIALGLLWGLWLPWRGEAAIVGALEAPADGQTVSGIGIVRGWAFAETGGVRIAQVTLRIDDDRSFSMPCCSARDDVRNAYPGYPAENTTDSGYGFTFNYGNLAAGPHKLAVEVRDDNGGRGQYTHTVDVVKPGGFAYIDRVDLAGASASREGQELRLSGLRARDAASQRVSRVDVRLRWFPNLQGLGIVDASTVGPASANAARRARATDARGSAAAEIPHAALESPGNGETGAGIAILRGWAIAPAGRSIRRVQLLVDGEPRLAIPCCSRRDDVAAAYPGEPNAADSGFGATFNHGNLAPGVHRLTVEIEDSGGARRQFVRGIVTRRPGDFAYLNRLDFGEATARIAGDELVVTGAVAIDQATGQRARGDLRYRWDVAAQAFGLVEESLDTLTVTNLNCEVNGDTSSVEALRANPGADGLSLMEAIAAINRRFAAGGRIAVDFATTGGRLSCGDVLLLGGIALDGDTDGDGIPDVTLSGSLATSGSDITVRGLSLQNDSGGQTPLRVGAPLGRSASDVAILANLITAVKELMVALGSSGPHVAPERAAARTPAASGENALSRVLMSGNRMRGETVGAILVDIDDGADPSLTEVSQINIFNNDIVCDGHEEGGYRWCDAVTFTNQHSQKETVVEAVVGENTIVNNADHGSNIFVGDIASDKPSLAASARMVDIVGNDISSDNGQYGVQMRGGYTASSQNNTTRVRVVENLIRGSFSSGIHGAAGAEGARHNTLIAEIKDNGLDVRLSEGSEGAIAVQGGIYASSNIADAAISRNAISASRQDVDPSGILLSGGIDCRGCAPPVPSLDNLVTGDIASNTVQDENPANPNIAVFGAEQLDPSSEVRGNQALADILHALLDRVVCRDNVSGNTAKCAISRGNRGESGMSPAPANGSPGEMLAAPPSARLARRLDAHRARLAEKEREFRGKAETTENPSLRLPYLEIADRLGKAQDKLTLAIERGK